MTDRKTWTALKRNWALGDKMPIGATIISVFIVVGFFGMAIMRFQFPEVKDDQNLTLMFGAMISAFSTVVSYWLGSSRSSATKDDAMQVTTAKLAESATSTITTTEGGKKAVRTTEAKPKGK